MGILKVIEWKDNSSDTIVYKVDLKRDYITKGSTLTVRDGQVAIFADKGRMADVFLPGYYKLDTNNVPVLTKLMSWKYGFESPFKSDVYFVNTKQFTNNKWGTMTPIMIRDKEFGAVRVTGYGTYSFRIKDAFVFMKELSGTKSSYETSDIVDYLKSIVITNISDAIGQCGVPVLDMAGNLLELGEIVQNSLNSVLDKMGIELTMFNFQNFSLPEKLEEVLDKQTELTMMRRNMDVYTTMAQADALKEAAKNPGMAGGMMGAGIGLGMGSGIGRVFSNMAQNQEQVMQKVPCSSCGAMINENAKFCPECGKATGNICPNCGNAIAKDAKFCPQCGKPIAKTCPSCGKEVQSGAKFCLECGQKL